MGRLCINNIIWNSELQSHTLLSWNYSPCLFSLDWIRDFLLNGSAKQFFPTFLLWNYTYAKTIKELCSSGCCCLRRKMRVFLGSQPLWLLFEPLLHFDLLLLLLQLVLKDFFKNKKWSFHHHACKTPWASLCMEGYSLPPNRDTCKREMWPPPPHPPCTYFSSTSCFW